MNNSYTRPYSSPSYHRKNTPVKRRTASARSTLYDYIEAILCFFDRLFDLLAAPAVRKTVKVSATLLCLVVFIGIIGGVESGLMTLGTGILISLMLIFVELLCIRP